jgi:hypothetical protein
VAYALSFLWVHGLGKMSRTWLKEKLEMTRSSLVTVFFVFILGYFIQACGNSNDNDSSNSACTAGETQYCECEYGDHFAVTGAQLCESDGMWSECDCGEEEWCDDTSGLCWQKWIIDGSYTWQEAIDYCDELTFAGDDDWRLPTISESRSFIRGCPGTITDGECGITDDCLDHNDCWSDSCDDCGEENGPGHGNCYCSEDATTNAQCDIGNGQYYWSSSSGGSDSDSAWGIDLWDGSVVYEEKTQNNIARCVRSNEGSDSDSDSDSIVKRVAR